MRTMDMLRQHFEARRKAELEQAVPMSAADLQFRLREARLLKMRWDAAAFVGLITTGHVPGWLEAFNKHMSLPARWDLMCGAILKNGGIVDTNQP